MPTFRGEPQREGSHVLIVTTDATEGADLARLFIRDSCPQVHVTDDPDEARGFAARLPTQFTSAAIIDVGIRGVDSEILVGDLRRVLPPRANLAVVGVSRLFLPQRLEGFDAVVLRAGGFQALRNVVRELLTSVQPRAALQFIVAIIGLEHSRPLVAHNATGTLIETASRRFLLTAAHVVDAIRSGEHRWSLGGEGQLAPLDGWEVIASNADLDLATVSPPVSFDPAELRRSFLSPEVWNPPRARVQDPAFLLGFPASLRGQRSDGVVVFRGVSLMEFVSSVSDTQFVLAPETTREVQRSAESAPLTDVGGVSGCPVFKNGENALELCGVVKEGLGGDDAVYIAAHAEFVRADGTIADWQR
jgi:hypothetical protein